MMIKLRKRWQQSMVQAWEIRVAKHLDAARGLLAVGITVPDPPSHGPVWKRDPLLEAARRLQREARR